MVVLISSGLVSRTGGLNPPVSVYMIRIHIRGEGYIIVSLTKAVRVLQDTLIGS